MSDMPTKSSDFLKRPRNLITIVILVFLIIQLTIFIPPFKHTNPATTHTVAWDSPQSEQFMRQSCYDCHSNETQWPWYSFVAPMSWLVGRDVRAGRDKLNFSTGYNLETGEIIESIREGEMPPRVYIFTHPNADLTDQETQEMIAGIAATFGPAEPGNGGEVEGHDGDQDDD
jgi:mono/diheme cytochrome c family protein